MKLSASLVALTVILSLSLVQVVGASNLIIENVESSKAYSGSCCYTVAGDVYNAGSTDSYGISVTAFFYASGVIVWVGSTIISNIPVGRSAQFVILITNAALASEITSYELTVSSN